MVTKQIGIRSVNGVTGGDPDNDRGDDLPVGDPIASGAGTGAGTGDNTGGGSDNQQPGTAKRTRKKRTPPQIAEAEISVETPPAVEPEKKKRSRKQTIKADGPTAAAGLLELVEVFTVARFGAEAAFSVTERFCIEAPLGRLIEKYAPLADKYGGLIDPVMVAAGAIMYATRIISLNTEVKSETSKPDPDASGAPLGQEPTPPGARADDPPYPPDSIRDLVGGLFK